jgi:hypothetical protein
MLSFDYSSFIETLVLYLFYTEEFPAKLAAAIDLEIAEAERDVAGFCSTLVPLISGFVVLQYHY